MRGQQTCPLTIHFNTPLAAALSPFMRLLYPPPAPTHDVNDVMCEG